MQFLEDMELVLIAVKTFVYTRRKRQMIHAHGGMKLLRCETNWRMIIRRCETLLHHVLQRLETRC